MYQINLLPWREQARKKKQARFAAIVACVAGLGLFCTVFVHLHYTHVINHQMERNALLQTTLDDESKVLMELNKQHTELVSVDNQLHFIFSLKESGYNAVHLLNELTLLNPDGVTLYKLIRTGNEITIFGKARSNLQITLFLENIEKSKFFAKPELTQIEGKGGAEGDVRVFQLKLQQEE